MDFISGQLISLTNPIHRIPVQRVNKLGKRLFCDKALLNLSAMNELFLYCIKITDDICRFIFVFRLDDNSYLKPMVIIWVVEDTRVDTSLCRCRRALTPGMEQKKHYVLATSNKIQASNTNMH